MFLRIANSGVCEVEAFTMFGVSSSRGEEGAIGQFGSGAKHAVLLCLRYGLSPEIYLGEEKLTFRSEKFTLRGKEYSSIFYTYREQEHKLSYVLEFGALDWTDIGMALREFISNAIDNGGGEWSVSISSTACSDSYSTCIYVPLTPSVEQYFAEKEKYFLHFQKLDHLQTVPNIGKRACRIYRKGVFVRELEDAANSLFHYNYGEDLKIDECRNLDDTRAKTHIATYFSSREQLVRMMFRVFRDNIKCMERDLPYVGLNGKPSWKDWWKEETCGALICSDSSENSEMVQKVINNGYTVIALPHGWYSELKRCGVQDYRAGLSEADYNNVVEVTCPPSLTERVASVHKLLNEKFMTNGKPMPKVRCFEGHSKPDGSRVCGFCSMATGTIWISNENLESISTILEELGHHYTGCADETRAFQDFAFTVAARFIQEKML